MFYKSWIITRIVIWEGQTVFRIAVSITGSTFSGYIKKPNSNSSRISRVSCFSHHALISSLISTCDLHGLSLVKYDPA